MTISTQDLGELLSDALNTVLDGLRGAVAGFGQALSFERLVTLLEPPMVDLFATVTELATARPADNERFLARFGSAPGPGQMTLEDFAGEVARLIEDGWTDELVTIFGAISGPPVPAAPGPGPVAPPGLGANVIATVTAFAPLADPEVWIRFGTQLRGLVSGTDAARRVADHVLEAARDAARAWAADWPDDIPLTDEEKEQVEPDVALPEIIGEWIDAVVSQIPGATRPQDSTGRVGRDVHRAVFAHYATTHPDRLTVYDGRVRIINSGVDVRVSRIWSAQGASLDPLADVPKLTRFSEVMRDPQTQRAVRPDIADLESVPSNPRDDWGWFEIKPMEDLREAVEEIYAYYLRLWNSATVRPLPPDWRGEPGVWQPTILIPTPNHKVLFAAVTVAPGAIGYLSYNLAKEAEVALIVAISALADMLLRRLLVSIRRALTDAGRSGEYVFQFVAAWAVVLIGLLLVAWAGVALLAEVSVAGILGSVGFAIEKIVRLIMSAT